MHRNMDLETLIFYQKADTMMIQDVPTISAVDFFVLLLIFGEEDFCGV